MNENLEQETLGTTESLAPAETPTPEMIAAREAQRARLAETEQNPGFLSPKAKELLEAEEQMIRAAVESAQTPAALAEFVGEQVLFYGREPVVIDGRNYTYAQAIKDVAGGVLDVEMLPNVYGIQDRMRSIVGKRGWEKEAIN